MNETGFVPIQPGETITTGMEGERPLSAPPPPGFVDGPAEQRETWVLNELIASSTQPEAVVRGQSKSRGVGANPSDYTAETATANTYGSHSTGTARMMVDRTHSTSFGNMAASYLGSELVESMEDAMQERPLRTGTQDPTYRRMARHTANRMVGSSPAAVATPAGMMFPSNERTGISYVRPATANNAAAHGFPTSLSSPQRPGGSFEEQPAEAAEPRSKSPHRSSSSGPPVSTIDIAVQPREDESHPDFTSQGGWTDGGNTSHFTGSEVGPVDATIGSDSNRSLKELERGMKNMWVPEAREFKPATGPPSQESSISEPVTELSPRQAENELMPFLWDDRATTKASRTLSLLHCSWLRAADVRQECERFGILEGFRADFSSRGIFFISYVDIRSAQYAMKDLQDNLQRKTVMQGGSEEVLVKYCLSMSAASQTDDSRIVFSGLPYDVNEFGLNEMLSSFGSVRSIMKDQNGNFRAEFHNLQDSKQAMFEIESSQLLGPKVQVNVSIRDPAERKRGRELLAMLNRWRQSTSRTGSVSSGKQRLNHLGVSVMQQPSYNNADANPWLPESSRSHGMGNEPAKRQFVLGPDGLYTEVIVTNNGNYPQHMSHHHHNNNPKQQQVIQGADGQYYVTSGPSPIHMQQPQQPQQQSRQGNYGRPQHSSQYPPSVISTGGSYGEQRSYYGSKSDANSLSGKSYRSAHSAHSNYSTATSEERDNRHLTLDLTAVGQGRDTRTSLMVRNIPNKYTQHMLLSEFEENGHGPGVIDFFYLPIDFKNRCNRGYAFINFVHYQDILQFHQRYYGKHWRTFNSDKICDITYARIQGKDAMLKRFENSALMEKDDEYKPLVFVSDGPQKGQRLAFPDPNRGKGRVEV